ncbi:MULTISPECIES: 8-amino-7-oxononanoate synthase [unclassified Flavobacterium]|uniref:8-amino-7-oxononanoate synthase n=1 Tax=unclassified Flavobacterium TaxID=196869 RepID=UPI000965BA38|nr:MULTISPECIES: 8-amino-7-oxononanoate synthase [unclassified Flavobacterium]MBN9284072.1 GNAT family N-acetyltransferase [Flavobacterium sp.]OJV73285.1 MAG: 8-amino-7-oxononanoate synthase [Flavobacterium sp. 40-81]HRB72989.1 8-amino-7-oxononanoate synthase [Flavobacterium sp.]
MNTDTTYKIYPAVSEVPTNWDTIAHSNIFLSTAYLKALEKSAPANMICHYIGLFQNQELVGIALSQFLDLNKVGSFGERDNCLKTSVRNFVFKNFSSHVLFIGNNMLTGQNAYALLDTISNADAVALLFQASEALKEIFRKKRLKIHLTVFKDFSETETEYFKTPDFASFYRFTTQPNMVFDIPESWQHETDYIQALTKKYRDQYKRSHKKAEAIQKKKFSLDDIQAHNPVINRLYENVAKNAPFNTFFLADNHFYKLKKLLKDQFLFYGYFLDDKLIGFNTLIKNGTAIDTYFLGYDEEHQREKMLYLNMLYDMVAYSINKGFSKIVFARTALEIKSSIGAKPQEMYGYIRHSNPLVNRHIARLFKSLEPETLWQERNPFK